VVAALAKAEAAGVVIAEDVKGLCVDTTSCTVVALDEGTTKEAISLEYVLKATRGSS